MKRKLFYLCVLFSLYATKIDAQFEPSAYSTTAMSSVRVYEATTPEKDANSLIGKAPLQTRQTTQYFDGLGRPIQTVVKQGSPLGFDVVSPTVYDNLGRVQYGFLPFVSTQTPGGSETTNDGEFKLNPFQQQKAFYQVQLSGQNQTFFYGKTDYDGSPMNLVAKSYQPGNSWVGSNVGTAITYDFNKVEENVHVWEISSSTTIPSTTSTQVYETGKLSRMISEDEKGKKLITYTDLSGNTILKKVQDQDGSSLSNEHSGWACTYYVYNDFNQLRFIITPKAVDWLNNNNWNLTNTVVEELCFRCEYDERGRVIVKKQPGIGESYTVYDKKDRVVLTQEANLDKFQNSNISTSTWMFSLYDEFDRIVATGLLANNRTRQSLQDDINNSVSSTGTVLVSAFTGNGVYQSLSVNNPVAGYGANDALLANSNNVYNSVTHYDDHNYQGAKPFNSSYSLAYQPPSQNVETLHQNNRTLGFVTGEAIRVLDNDNNPANDKFLYSTAYYDERGRTIESLADNHKGGTDYSVNQYDFAGKLMSAYVFHQITGRTALSIVSKNEYDATGRLLRTSKNFNQTGYKTLSEFAYDELGKVKLKTLDPGYNGTGSSEMEKLNYAYNIHGSLAGINKDFALSSDPFNQWDHFFGLYLGYDDNVNFTQKEWNGNITGAIWRSQGDNAVRKYDYTFDNLGRFTSANFHQKKNPMLGWANDIDFSSNVQYEDLNGNIHSLTHMGIVPGGAGSKIIDNLAYRYNTLGGGLTLQGNKLMEVQDGGNLLPGDNGLGGDFKDGNNSSGTDDYDYDPNGNLLKDLNKNIKIGSSTGIVYNFLNKVQKLTLEKTETTEIEYLYDASGEKLSKTVTKLPNASNNNTKTIIATDYVGDFVYESKTISPTPNPFPNYTDKLLYIVHEEGRLKMIDEIHDFDRDQTAGNNGINLGGTTRGVFEYFLKDNLGNTRMVLTEEEQKEKYYATNETNNPANDLSKQAKLFGAVDPSGNPLNNELLQSRVLTNTTPWDGNGNTSTWVNQLTASTLTTKVGPNMLLKVMAGDQISTSVRYYFTQFDNSQLTNPVQDAAYSLLNALYGYKGTVSSQHSAPAIQSSLNNDAILGTFLSDHGISNPANPNAPRAYLNVIFLDEQFHFIPNDYLSSDEKSLAKRVGNANTDDHLDISQKAPKNGWAFVFVNNESNASVYFDDMSVVQEHGNISEENHYYPFGLKIAGISSKAFNKLQNNYGYQGDFSEEDEETEWNEFALRNYDPQTARWVSADPYDQFASPFTAMGNNPVHNVDPDGGYTYSYSTGIGQAVGAVLGAVLVNWAINTYNNSRHDKGKEGIGDLARIGLVATGAILGSGIGYTIEESLFVPHTNQGGGTSNLWQNFKAYNVALFNPKYEGNFGSLPRRDFYAENARLPKLWNGINLPDISVSVQVNFKRILPYWNLFNEPSKQRNPETAAPGGYSDIGFIYRLMVSTVGVFGIPFVTSPYAIYNWYLRNIIRVPIIKIHFKK